MANENNTDTNRSDNLPAVAKTPAPKTSGFKRVEALVSFHRWNLGGRLVDLVKGQKYVVADHTAAEMEKVGHGKITEHDVERPEPLPAIQEGNGGTTLTPGGAAEPTPADKDREARANNLTDKLPEDLETFLSRMKPADLQKFAKDKLDLDIPVNMKKSDAVTACLDRAKELHETDAEIEGDAASNPNPDAAKNPDGTPKETGKAQK